MTLHKSYDLVTSRIILYHKLVCRFPTNASRKSPIVLQFNPNVPEDFGSISFPSWGTSPFADMRAEPPVGRRSPTHQRGEAVAVLAGRAVVHRLRREGWRRAKGRQVDTVLRHRCRRVQRGGLEDARVLVEGERLLPNFSSREGAARCKISQDSSAIAR